MLKVVYIKETLQLQNVLELLGAAPPDLCIRDLLLNFSLPFLNMFLCVCVCVFMCVCVHICAYIHVCASMYLSYFELDNILNYFRWVTGLV